MTGDSGRRAGLALGVAVSAALLPAGGRAHANPDLELGAYLANECQTCHRFVASGRKAAIPDLTGMAAETMVEVLKAYRSRQLTNPVMRSVAGRMKDDEIAAVAAYFATRKR